MGNVAGRKGINPDVPPSGMSPLEMEIELILPSKNCISVSVNGSGNYKEP